MDKPIIKFKGKGKGIKIAKIILRRKVMEGRVTVANFKTGLLASVIKSVDYNTDQWTRAKKPRDRPTNM